MAENLMVLKRKAMQLGMDRAHASKAARGDLEAFISEHSEPVVKKSVVKKRKKVAAASPAPVAKKRGRPPGSKNKKTAAPAAAVKKTVAKKATKAAPAKRKTTPKAKSSTNGEIGRAVISKIDYSVESDEWNPRKGSPVERIWKTLKKYRDNVDKTFDELLPYVKEIVGAKKRNGERRTKAEFEAMLRYRINRTRFEYAVRTNQHSKATNRVEYGTGRHAQATKKTKRTRKTVTK